MEVDSAINPKMVEETARGVRDALAVIPGEPAALLLFSCGGRLLQARAQGVTEPFCRAMCQIPTAGFTTYGEQYGPMQVNHTLTGAVIGWPDGR